MTGKDYAAKRKELGLSQAALAERLGYDSSTVGAWEVRDEVPTYAVRALEMLTTLTQLSSMAATAARLPERE